MSPSFRIPDLVRDLSSDGEGIEISSYSSSSTWGSSSSKTLILLCLSTTTFSSRTGAVMDGADETVALRFGALPALITGLLDS